MASIISFLRSGLRSSIPQLVPLCLSHRLALLFVIGFSPQQILGGKLDIFYFSSLALASCPFKKAFGENTEAKEILASLSEMEFR